MAANHRLFVDQKLASGELLTVTDQASHYLTRVLRLQAGAAITVFNGDGNNYQAELVHADKRTAQLQIHGSEPGPRATPQLHLAIALLKGDKLDYALQKATELDVTKVWLVNAKRSELRMSAKRLTNRLQHWQRIMHSACEQSGRTWVPEVAPPQPLTEVLEQTRHLQCYCLEPTASAGELVVGDKDICLFTGPEGGFAAEELTLLTQQCTGVQLGELVLRAETAPLVGLALAGAARRKAAAAIEARDGRSD